MKKLFFTGFVWIASSTLVLVLLLVTVQYHSPISFLPSLDVLSFFTPLLIVFNLILFLFLLFKRKKIALIPLLVVVFAYYSMGTFFKKTQLKSDGLSQDISVFSYNIQSFYGVENKGYEETPKPIEEFVNSVTPDIICLQESTYSSKVYPIFKNYKFNYVDVDGDTGRRGRVVGAIYSKYPIVNYYRILFPESYNGAFYADILYKKDTIRIFNVHLQSYNVEPEVDKLQKENSSRLLKRIEKRIKMQDEQAKIVKSFVDKSPYKTLITGDFNNTQFSNIYNTLKGGFQDTFLEKGQGFGRSYKLFGIPIRIDYILADESFEVVSHQNYDVEFSDHYPIMAKLNLKSHQ